MSDQLKDMFDAARYRSLASELSALSPAFNATTFLDHTLTGLSSRELMDRMRRTSTGVALALPLPYREQLAVLRALAARIDRGFIGIFLSDFVAQHGLDDVPASLDALRFFTRFGSAEFAIRPFILRDQAATLAVLLDWSVSEDEHVRRLASEGSRPRLPWGARLQSLVADPSPTFPILETLRADDSLYVRKSVANHLNDIAKDHPDRVIALLKTWDDSDARTAWIIRHALRTLIKAGRTEALELIGAGAAARLDVDCFQAAPRKLALGDTLALTATITSRANKSQRLVIDYVIHYARARGTSSQKVFKWKTLDLPARGNLTLTKRQTIRDFSTRRHHAGRHIVELQINGRRLAEAAFSLSV
ncbi:DNA alkylation repair protein [Rariglobus hedericola]|uniref:DNA alkylation repair protein n=1 Tax=Rariglobus hedericola TaxID=2597822 RepID=A0A556QNG0_9BACT|nr:DNA alkylation repair protein [Rariglobus hedericola]TSJ78175.1 DNA alkylation repair protein [Rariglobus hedericola]